MMAGLPSATTTVLTTPAAAGITVTAIRTLLWGGLLLPSSIGATPASCGLRLRLLRLLLCWLLLCWLMGRVVMRRGCALLLRSVVGGRCGVGGHQRRVRRHLPARHRGRSRCAGGTRKLARPATLCWLLAVDSARDEAGTGGPEPFWAVNAAEAGRVVVQRRDEGFPVESVTRRGGYLRGGRSHRRGRGHLDRHRCRCGCRSLGGAGGRCLLRRCRFGRRLCRLSRQRRGVFLRSHLRTLGVICDAVARGARNAVDREHRRALFCRKSRGDRGDSAGEQACAQRCAGDNREGLVRKGHIPTVATGDETTIPYR